MVVNLDGQSVALFAHKGRIYAVDNRCPHMGFPLHRGSVADGILTCHWHHARFDLATGGTFDQFADDLPCYRVEARDGEVWVDLAPRGDPTGYHLRRLREGLEHEIPLVVAKASIALAAAGMDPAEPFRIGLDFGTRYRREGWGMGLTILTCLANLVPFLDPADRPRAHLQGLAATARDAGGRAPRFAIAPLPGAAPDLATLTRWFRRFVEVRDEEGAERCIVTAVRAGAGDREMAGMIFAAATDHRFLSTGHVLDFTNKAFEALDRAGWEHAEGILASLAPAYAGASRSEELNSWRHPVDLVALLQGAFDRLPAALEQGARRDPWPMGAGRRELIGVLLGEDAVAIVDALVGALAAGCPPERLAGIVTHAAALRIARFPVTNEFGDWDTSLHTYTFANAVHQGLCRVHAPELVRGLFDAAARVYLDRFLNVPPARLPDATEPDEDADAILAELPGLLDRRHQVNAAGTLVARYLGTGAEPKRLLARLGTMLLREDRDFHTIQTLEASVRQWTIAMEEGRAEDGLPLLVAAARYLAAHAPTMRSQDQTYTIALRLSRGERLYEDVD